MLDYLRSGYQNLVYHLSYLWYIFQSYAWHIVFGAIILYYIFTKFLSPVIEWAFEKYECFRKRKEEHDYAAKYHKNPDLFAERISVQQAYAQKLQEKYDQQAKEYQAKLKEKENMKKQELLNLLNQGGQRLGGNSDKDNSQVKSLKPDYNPLMGAGSSSSYRPPKRKCGGGGCGK